MRQFAVAGMMLSSLVSVEAQDRAADKLQLDAWKACVAAKAQRYSKGPDSAEVVVRVALLACKSERDKLREQLEKDRSMSPAQHVEVLNILEVGITNDVLLQVMELRVPK